MTPLDLGAAPPRVPREELVGVLFLPRTIDKFRAMLPGGNLGEYTLSGFSQMMLDELDIPVEAFTACVAAAKTDEDVATFVQAHAKPEKIAVWNAFVSQRQPRGGNRVEALVAYPWLHAHPDMLLALDVLAEDDKQHFMRP